MLKVQPRVTFLRNDQNDAAADSIADNNKKVCALCFVFVFLFFSSSGYCNFIKMLQKK